MTDEEKYLFDLQGYVVLKNVVPQELVDGCNEALDRYDAFLADSQTIEGQYVSL